MKESTEDIYKVIAGSFKYINDAERQVKELRTKKIDALITKALISGETFYRVQAGAFFRKENAERRVEKLAEIGVQNAFIIGEKYERAPIPERDNQFTIKGNSYLSAKELDHFVRMVNKNALSTTEYYIKYGNVYGIRGDAAFAQAILETDYFRFTGSVRKEQNNFAGIGSTSQSNRGNSFSTPEEGVHAHIQHLYAYASCKKIPAGYPLIDPRFHLVKRGSAPTWVELNGKWAVPGRNYGQKIISIYRRILNFISD